MKKSWFCLALAAALLIALPARATLLNFHVNLSGANEVPPTPSPATGFADLTLDTITNDLTGHIEFSGLLAGTSAAHIHCCLDTPFGPGNAGVATLVPAFPNFPLGVTSGIDDFVLDLDLASSYNPAFITLQGGLANAEASFIGGLQSGRTYTEHPHGTGTTRTTDSRRRDPRLRGENPRADDGGPPSRGFGCGARIATS